MLGLIHVVLSGWVLVGTLEIISAGLKIKQNYFIVRRQTASCCVVNDTCFEDNSHQHIERIWTLSLTCGAGVSQ